VPHFRKKIQIKRTNIFISANHFSPIASPVEDAQMAVDDNYPDVQPPGRIFLTNELFVLNLSLSRTSIIGADFNAKQVLGVVV